MYQSMYEDSLDTEVLTAEPIKLVELMYRGAIDAVAGARTALAAGHIKTRSQLISKASAILNELALSLNHSVDAELCRNLVELYDYMLRKLIEANVSQTEGPLVEVENLLKELFGAWHQADPKQEATTGGQASAYSPVEPSEYRPLSVAC